MLLMMSRMGFKCLINSLDLPPNLNRQFVITELIFSDYENPL